MKRGAVYSVQYFKLTEHCLLFTEHCLLIAKHCLS